MKRLREMPLTLEQQLGVLAGMIALQEKNWDAAISELQQASQQDAYNLYRLCQLPECPARR